MKIVRKLKRCCREEGEGVDDDEGSGEDSSDDDEGAEEGTGLAADGDASNDSDVEHLEPVANPFGESLLKMWLRASCHYLLTQYNSVPTACAPLSPYHLGQSLNPKLNKMLRL